MIAHHTNLAIGAILQVKKEYEVAQAKFEKAMSGSPKDKVEANMALKRARALVQLSD